MKQKQVLENLYALRAGLSVISQQYDKAQGIENEFVGKLISNAQGMEVEYSDNEYGELVKLKKHYGYDFNLQNKFDAEDAQFSESNPESVEHYESKQNRSRENANKARKAFAHWLALDESTKLFQRNLMLEKDKKDRADQGNVGTFNYKKEYKREKRLSILFFVLAAIFAAGAIVIASGALGPWDMGVLIGVFILPLVVFLVLGIVYVFKSKRDKLQHTGKVGQADGQVRIAQQLLDKLPQVRENARKILKEKDERITPIKENCNDFYMALKKQFNPLLDERDWKNLDLVIFELETRRADNLKEALQLVDRELQTERIEQTIVQATEQICYELRRGFAEIKETILECGRVISEQLSTVSLQLGAMNEQLSELCDGVNMSNALQAKANVTSTKLLSDVHAIRYYQ